MADADINEIPALFDRGPPVFHTGLVIRMSKEAAVRRRQNAEAKAIFSWAVEFDVGAVMWTVIGRHRHHSAEGGPVAAEFL